MTLRRSAARLLVATLVGGLAALLTRYTLSPARHVMRADFAALILDGCPAAKLLLDEVTADPAVADVLLLAPLEFHEHPLGQRTCRETLRVLRQRGVWSVAVLPEAWACDWMAADLREAMKDGMNGSPTYLRRGEVVQLSQIEAAMTANGLSYKPSATTHGIRLAGSTNG
ncbi:hypothetical protein [Nannocystis punicea]|uniref:Methyltransferase domain-containing protein n=1 Tax=Nannocystis punicea TaxID=2995304 RepID=A0ABY7HBR6_9BACT|nr:hypothetical protein [Nannocystis poenicansa]WAS96646.1 hypothetical protein O0S08_10870 [Nannocystis poenicansa]